MLTLLLLLLVSPSRGRRAPSRRGNVRLALRAPVILVEAGRGYETCSVTSASSPFRSGDGRRGTSSASAPGSHGRGPGTRDDALQDRSSWSAVGLQEI